MSTIPEELIGSVESAGEPVTPHLHHFDVLSEELLERGEVEWAKCLVYASNEFDVP